MRICILKTRVRNHRNVKLFPSFFGSCLHASSSPSLWIAYGHRKGERVSHFVRKESVKRCNSAPLTLRGSWCLSGSKDCDENYSKMELKTDYIRTERVHIRSRNHLSWDVACGEDWSSTYPSVFRPFTALATAPYLGGPFSGPWDVCSLLIRVASSNNYKFTALSRKAAMFPTKTGQQRRNKLT